jgi:hypothetical protein
VRLAQAVATACCFFVILLYVLRRSSSKKELRDYLVIFSVISKYDCTVNLNTLFAFQLENID